MSIATILYTGQRALSTHQTAIQVAGQNIANVNTPGYSRQRADLAPHQIALANAFLMAGVDVEQVSRAYDQFVTAQVNDATSRFQSLSEQADILTQIEALFNEFDLENAGLSSALEKFFNYFQDLANEPESLPARNALLQRGEIVADTMRQADDSLQTLQQTLGDKLEYELAEVNTIVSQIADLNRRMGERAGTRTIELNTLRDKRDSLIKQVAEKIGITAFASAEGQVTVMLKGGPPLIEGPNARRLVSQPDPDDPQQRTVHLESAAGHRIDVTPSITSGKLHGLLEIQQSVIPHVMAGLDRLASQLTTAVNRVHSAGFDLDGNTGHDFFIPRQVSGQALSDNTGGGRVQRVTVVDPTQVPLDDVHVTFVSDGPPPRYDIVNTESGDAIVSGQTYVQGAPVRFAGLEVVIADDGTAPQTADTFLIKTTQGAARYLAVQPDLLDDPRQIAAAQMAAPGDNANALALANLRQEQLIDGSTFGAFYTHLVTQVGVKSHKSADSVEQQQFLLSEVENRRESISGVSLEEEQIDLIRFQQAFAAAARLITIADELNQSILELIR